MAKDGPRKKKPLSPIPLIVVVVLASDLLLIVLSIISFILERD
jgi:hypothetical protein